MNRRGGLLLVAALAALLSRPALAADTPSDSSVTEPEYLSEEQPDYDPWKPFNEKTFSFNYDVLDKRVLKPLARVWSRILPYGVRHGIENFFDNLAMPKRLANDLLQARPKRAGEQIARFAINTTVGAVGFLDIADRIGVHPSEADGGQTLGVWGFGQGPYLVLPFLPPLTVRDGIGYGGDGTMDPIGYFAPVPLAVSIATTVVRRVNDRSLTPAAFENIEDTVIDVYSAVRNVYLQRRRRSVERGRAESLLFNKRVYPAPRRPPR